jgi:hypothetical protein
MAMARAILGMVASRYAAAVLAGGLLGGYLGLASAQDTATGSLDPACAARCAASGNEAEFCGQVCWVPSPEIAARSHPVDWDCYSACRGRNGRAADCMPACRTR